MPHSREPGASEPPSVDSVPAPVEPTPAGIASEPAPVEPAPVAAPEPTPVAAPEPTPVAAPVPTPVAAPEPTPRVPLEPTPAPGTPVAAPGRQNLLDTSTVTLPPELTAAPASMPAPPAAAPAPTPAPSFTAPPLADSLTPLGVPRQVADSWFLATGAPPPVRAEEPGPTAEDLPMPLPRKPAGVGLYVGAIALVGGLVVIGLVLLLVVFLLT